MAFDISEFRLRFPEFRAASDALVVETAEAAALDIGLDEYRDKANEALLYLTAWKLSDLPFGRDLRPEDSDKPSRYEREFRRITRLIRWPFMVT
jgi:hypothetical protein